MCGEPLDDEARGGVRFTDTKQIGQFRKAIVQAQEEYKIQAGEDLIFFHWTGVGARNPMKSHAKQELFISFHGCAGSKMCSGSHAEDRRAVLQRLEQLQVCRLGLEP